eukprot:scaffold6449_cov148-Skeletonema_menzelii.AAC.1
MESVQPYNEGGWKYADELAKFVEGGMEGTSFIDAVSGIVNRGCHNPVTLWDRCRRRDIRAISELQESAEYNVCG